MTIAPGTSVAAIQPVAAAEWGALAARLPPAAKAQAAFERFAGQLGAILAVRSPDGRLNRILFGTGDGPCRAMNFRALAACLPPGEYAIGPDMDLGAEPGQIALAWSLGTYRFDRYKKEAGDPPPRLAASAGADMVEVHALAEAFVLARDMINAPANHMGPGQIEAIAREIAEANAAAISVICGDALIGAGYPAVHAVGRAAAPDRAPRMIEITWGEAEHPLIALIGKGVVFDTGGLDIKASAGMRLMKKDMGGAAHALGLAQMIMAARLPVRLVVLVPVVENAIAGEAMRPGDVLASRAGLTIEVGNTDAEGRLILADALSRAAELAPVLTIDLATLTGAARVALGPQISAFYTDDDALAAELGAASREVDDPIWRMPLWQGYASSLDSDIADIRNDSEPWAQAGSVTAALFLHRFAPRSAWVHFDIFAWNPRSRPGWPQGAEVQAIRALYAVLKARYA